VVVAAARSAAVGLGLADAVVRRGAVELVPRGVMVQVRREVMVRARPGVTALVRRVGMVLREVAVRRALDAEAGAGCSAGRGARFRIRTWPRCRRIGRREMWMLGWPII
jgi:hypothetical protein